MTLRETHTAYRQAFRTHGNDYITVCPFCGHTPIVLISFSATCDIPISTDGWDLTEGRIDTDKERFLCPRCGTRIPPACVFGTLS